jgi:hypothetical protein
MTVEIIRTQLFQYDDQRTVHVDQIRRKIRFHSLNMLIYIELDFVYRRRTTIKKTTTTTTTAATGT